jgi:hypothetical protein
MPACFAVAIAIGTLSRASELKFSSRFLQLLPPRPILSAAAPISMLFGAALFV